jgi:S-methylmethionine-dependent homocysteine/selenocysteine methylase
MARYRRGLPQLGGDLFLTDAGLETDLIFNRGIEIREFAAHTLLPDAAGRQALTDYYRRFLSLAGELDAGFILDTQTWKAHPHWAEALGADDQALRRANRESAEYVVALREEFAGNEKPIVLNGFIGPRGDAYAPETEVAEHEAENYHATQVGWLAETGIDMVTAMTFAQSPEAVGVVRAASAAGLPAVVSFTVETDGRLPSGQPLGEAIEFVDRETDSAAAYFMINCAHPDHFFHILDDSDWAKRIRGVRCNASRMSHAELDDAEQLDDGDPVEFGESYGALKARMPWLNVFGGCCGSDFRHVAEAARHLTASRQR